VTNKSCHTANVIVYQNQYIWFDIDLI